MTFKKERIVNDVKVSNLILSELDLSISQAGDDFVRQLFTMRLEAFILSRLNEEKTITVYKERPSFLDWLLRRRRAFTFEFSCKEVLINPPALPKGKSAMMYTAEPTN